MDELVFLKSARIQLRALTEKDLTEEYLQWLNDDEVCRHNSHAIFPNTEQKMKNYFTHKYVVLFPALIYFTFF